MLQCSGLVTRARTLLSEDLNQDKLPRIAPNEKWIFKQKKTGESLVAQPPFKLTLSPQRYKLFNKVMSIVIPPGAFDETRSVVTRDKRKLSILELALFMLN